MKKLIIIAAFTLISGFSYSQFGYYFINAIAQWDRGGVEVHINELDGSTQITYGSRGGWKFSDNFEGGFGVYYSYHRFTGIRSRELESLITTSSTWYLEYHISRSEQLDLSIPFHLGYGWSTLEEVNYTSYNDYGTHFLIQPGVQLNLYPFDWMRVYLGGSYRLILGNEFENLPNATLSTPTGYAGISFGRYDP